MATTLLRTRVDRVRAKQASAILARLGLKPSDAVNMFFAQVITHRGIPFAVQEEGYAYAASEYGVTAAELDATARRIGRNIVRERKAGSLKVVRSPDDLL